jgi:Fe-S-cluster containining protein
MGEIIEIKEELGPFLYRIKFSVTGEERIVSIDPDKQNLFHNQDIRTYRPMACPFLREAGGKKYVCSVHISRPDLCRQYACYRILVLDSLERKIGRVPDASRFFSTSDEMLRTLWNLKIADVEIPNEKDWEEHVVQTLTCAGYRVVH